MNMLRVVSSLSILISRSSWAFKFSKKLPLTAIAPMIRRMGISSNKVDVQDKGIRHFNHRGDWGRIAELTDAIYSNPKNISNWKERARLYKESDLLFNAYADICMMELWSSKEEAKDWQV